MCWMGENDYPGPLPCASALLRRRAGRGDQDADTFARRTSERHLRFDYCDKLIACVDVSVVLHNPMFLRGN